MKKTVVFFFLLHVFLPFLNGQSVAVSDSAIVSLITCSPGPIAYEKFGHTAIRYQEPANHTDIVFNYGIFNFNIPNFYMKFVEGNTYYLLGAYDTQQFLPEYKERNSQVTEQILNLTPEEKRNLINALYVNNLPENREYLYNLMFDNCATRPRDMIVNVLRKKKIEYQHFEEKKTFREWVASYTGEKSWLQFGIDLIFGKDADRYASQSETMFLPEILSEEMGTAKIIDNDSVSRPLIAKTNILVSKKAVTAKNENKITQPLIVTSLILLIFGLVTFFEFRKRRHFRIIDSILLLITGSAGIVIFFLMFISIQPLVKSNFNILWCNPLNAFLAIFILLRKMDKVSRYFQILNVLLFISVLVIAALSLQILNVAFLPIIILLLIRSLYWLVVRSRRKKRSKRSSLSSNRYR